MRIRTSNCWPYWLLLVALATWCNLPAHAQTPKLNDGLTQPQAPATLPRAQALATAPVRRAKVPPRTVLAAAPDGQLYLTQGWALAAANHAGATGLFLGWLLHAAARRAQDNYGAESWRSKSQVATLANRGLQQPLSNSTSSLCMHPRTTRPGME